MENKVQFTEDENKIRKKWLFWSIKIPAFILGCLVIAATVGLCMAPDFMGAVGITFLLLLSGGLLYMAYHCAYKNPGTILLLLGMIGTLLNSPITFLELVSFLKLKNSAPIELSIAFSSFLLTLLFYDFIVFYYSYKLRKINKKIQERRLTSSPAYMDAVSAFSTAANLEELDQRFMKLKISHDSDSAIKALARAYDQQKKTLKA